MVPTGQGQGSSRRFSIPTRANLNGSVRVDNYDSVVKRVSTNILQTGRAARNPPVIGIIAALGDYTVLAPVLAAEGRTVMLDERSAIAALRDESIDLLIVAPRHDWWAECATIADLQAEATRAEATVLAMVPRGDAVALALAFDSGVADCVAYPFDAPEVAVRVQALMRRKAIADRRRVAADEVRRLALTDPLTGLWNRHFFDTDLVAQIERATASGRRLSLLMIDIDRFKPINDRHGHAIGDKVLRTVSARLGSGIRTGDTLARFGGDELVLVMPDTGIEVASLAGERLRGLVAAATDLPFGVTVSIGVAELGFDEPALSLLARADKALYAAKLGGRDQVAAAS